MQAEEFNLGRREQLKRRVLGKVALACVAGLIIALVAAGAPRWARLGLFVPLWMAALGFTQAKEKVCIALAARGTCNLDGTEAPIRDAGRVARLRQKAKAIHRRALLIAALGTLAFIACPPY
ncbi:MAG TPA: hypothetical protein VN442_20895 [Bryobacteraceae bacterium]|nr:hypothetical protein [Bryobacteraceae bacterium]